LVKRSEVVAVCSEVETLMGAEAEEAEAEEAEVELTAGVRGRVP
jgi:hypothetical protein